MKKSDDLESKNAQHIKADQTDSETLNQTDKGLDHDNAIDSFVEALDAEKVTADEETLTRLQAVRYQALDSIPVRRPSAARNWVWLSSTSVACLALVAVVTLYIGEQKAPNARLTASELEWLLESDELDVVSQDFAFYDWVDAELNESGTKS